MRRVFEVIICDILLLVIDPLNAIVYVLSVL